MPHHHHTYYVTHIQTLVLVGLFCLIIGLFCLITSRLTLQNTSRNFYGALKRESGDDVT